MLGNFTLSQDLVLGHFSLSQDLTLKCWDNFTLFQDHPLKRWDTSYCPKTLSPSVGTLHTVPRPFVLVLGHFTLSQDLVLGHLVLSQDLILKCWDTSHCPKTDRSSVGTLRTIPRPFHLSVGTLRTVPRPFHSSVGTLRTVPRLPAQVFRLLVLSSDIFVPVLGQSDLFFFGVGKLRSLSMVPPLEP